MGLKKSTAQPVKKTLTVNNDGSADLVVYCNGAASTISSGGSSEFKISIPSIVGVKKTSGTLTVSNLSALATDGNTTVYGATSSNVTYGINLT